MSRDTLQKLIADFDLQRFKRFFSEKNRKFKESNDNLDYLADGMFSSGRKLGMLPLEDGRMIVCAIEVKKGLTERSGKKAQYEIGKRILKNTQMDAGIFIFFNQAGAFRYSLIYANYLGKKRDWSAFRRFTYFVNKDFTNKTFLQRIGDGDFSSLTNIKDAFSVEKVTKEFYEDIANWYFWAIDNCHFPKDAEAEDNGRNIAVIRLITRMIFIWFMRERGLVPKDLFEGTKVATILKGLAAEESTYYQAILQNLFFATLSTKKEERKFRSEIRGIKGVNPDFGNQNVYRYHELFRAPDKIEDYFGEIPFLNGGLFECLDDKPKGINIDGFTSVKKNQPEVPNILFFCSEKKADLNAAYGTKGISYKIRGLLDILSSFNFTIDENSLDDQDIALDPELLGRVFENLLASFNPETSTTARKATGSYYTPREIVDYMVTESLKVYFATHLSGIDEVDKKLNQLFVTGSEENPFNKKESSKIVDLIGSVRIVDPAVGSGAFPMGALNKLVSILNKLDPGNELWKQAQLAAADSIPDSRIKKDTKSRIEEFFKSKNADYGRKLYLIQKCIYGVDIQEIAVEIAKLRFFISLLVDEKIDTSKDNMGIEPLPNLDFKIMQGNSLISEFMGIDFDANGNGGSNSLHLNEERIKSLKDDQNRLSSEFIRLYNSNSLDLQKQKALKEHLDKISKELMTIEKENLLKRETKSEDNKTNKLIKQFEQTKTAFQNEPDRDKKEKLKNEIDDLIIQIFETKLKRHKESYFSKREDIENKYSVLPNKKQREDIITREKQALSKKEGFDLEAFEKQLRDLTGKSKIKPFFAWHLYFAEVFENGGFDIVIANPPYITFKGKERVDVDPHEVEIYQQIYRNSAEYKINSFALFLERGLNLLSEGGTLAFIIPSTILQNQYLTKIRQYILSNFALQGIVTFGAKVFEAVTDSVIIIIQNRKPLSGQTRVIRKTDLLFGSSDKVLTLDQTKWSGINGINLKINLSDTGLIDRLMSKATDLGDICDVRIGIKRADAPVIGTPKRGYKPFLLGRDIEPFHITFVNRYILFDKSLFHTTVDESIFLQPVKILVRKTGSSLIAALDAQQYYTDQSIYNVTPLNSTSLPPEYIMAILNSRLMNYVFQKAFITNPDIYPYIKGIHLKKLPIKEAPDALRKQILETVSTLLSLLHRFQERDLNSTNKLVALKERLDTLIFKVYDLDPSDIELIKRDSSVGMGDTNYGEK